MHTFTLQEAKAKLNRLVELAHAGEDVVLLRGSHVVATIRPLSEADLEVAPTLTTAQAQRLHAEVRAAKRGAPQSGRATAVALKRRRAVA